MKIFIASLFPKLYSSFFSTSIIGRAINSGICSSHIIDMFDHVDHKKRIDSEIVGHGDGMLIGASIIEKIYDFVISENKKKPFTIFFSPHGKKLDQDLLKNLYHKIASEDRSLLMFAGRYEGFDVRAEEQYADEIISIGDFVLTGGDLPIMLFLEGLLRLIPGVVGKFSSVENDSFYNTFLDCPHYANPDNWKDKLIPSVLKSGNHKLIKNWREQEAIRRSIFVNWQWVSRHIKDNEEKKKSKNYYAFSLLYFIT